MLLMFPCLYLAFLLFNVFLKTKLINAGEHYSPNTLKNTGLIY